MGKVVKAVSKVISGTIGGALGIFGGGEKEQSAGAAPTAPEAAPTAISAETTEAREAQRKRQAAAAGLGANVLTSAAGLGGTAAPTQTKTLLGG